MWLGIDVGGTFTDAVVVSSRGVEATAKRATTRPSLLDGIVAALDAVLEVIPRAALDRVALSTTVVTNALVEGDIDPVGLLLLPGPGMRLDGLLPGPGQILDGAIDHRGREVRPPDPEALRCALAAIPEGFPVVVSGKFSVRNPRHEILVADAARRERHPCHVSLGSEMSGGLDFVRRTNSAWYNASVWRRFGAFADAVEAAMRERDVRVPLHVLKADGGTLPLAQARLHPVEAIFTGPASSVMGIVALGVPPGEAVSVDIGGTTTDIALWQGGQAVAADRGARVAGHATAVRAFWVQSVGLGGDSAAWRDASGALRVGPTRRGPAAAVGGPVPTVTDALVLTGRVRLGDPGMAAAALRSLATAGQPPEDVAVEVVEAAVSRLAEAIAGVIEERASEPAYRVDDIVHGARFRPSRIVAVGGGASGLAPLLAERMGISCRIPPHAGVANAIGAAVARPTLQATLEADGVEGFYTVPEVGVRGPLPRGRVQPEAGRRLAEEHLREWAGRAGIAADATEVVSEEAFNVIRGFETLGSIVRCRVQIRPGVLARFEPPADRDGPCTPLEGVTSDARSEALEP